MFHSYKDIERMRQYELSVTVFSSSNHQYKEYESVVCYFVRLSEMMVMLR